VQQGLKAVSFKLSRSQRARWAIGTPLRAGGFAAFTALICWLAFISIGLAAVAVILILVAVGHWVPFVLAGRNRLGASPDGLYDHVRFHKREFAWASIVRIHVVSPAQAVHGLVADVLDHSTGDVRGEFLRASWRPTRHDAETLLNQIESLGWYSVPSSG
jgi:hypothetical protein